jgi:hypothetical protein
VFLGIDFSGNHAQWRARCRTSNVWMARVAEAGRGLALVGLGRVQELEGTDAPFERLARVLATGDHDAAGIDAPFALPERYAVGRSHGELTALTARLPRGERPFPRAPDFVHGVTGRAPPLSPPKPYRRTEADWAARGVNVRSTLWAGARGGAAMTAACLTLLHRAACPVWPFSHAGPRLAVEAFPAAQLRQWGLPWQRYGAPADRGVREAIAAALGRRVRLGRFDAVVREHADALDAVLAAFGAVAVARGALALPPGGEAAAEGWIAVHA